MKLWWHGSRTATLGGAVAVSNDGERFLPPPLFPIFFHSQWSSPPRLFPSVFGLFLLSPLFRSLSLFSLSPLVLSLFGLLSIYRGKKELVLLLVRLGSKSRGGWSASDFVRWSKGVGLWWRRGERGGKI